MNFWRAVMASLLSLVCTLAVSAYVTLQTLNTTILDRHEVKTWLTNSGAYQRLLDTTLTSSLANDTASAPQQTAITKDVVKDALVQAFPPSFVQQSTEKVLDGTYDWLEGTKPSVTFHIDTPPYKQAFETKLSALLEPQLANLPRCGSITQFDPSNPTCLPPGVTAEQAASAAATDLSRSANIFTQPLTDDTIRQASEANDQSTAASGIPQAQQLPQLVSTMRMWLLWLPIIAVLSGVLSVVLSPRRLKAAKHLAGRLTFGLAATCALGLIIANLGKTMRVADYTADANNAVVTNIVEPIIHQAAPAIGNRLALTSGIIGAATLALWIVCRILWKRAEKAALLKAADAQPAPAAKQTSVTTPATDDEVSRPNKPAGS